MSRAATWYMTSRQVQKVPEPTWTVPRRARWKAWRVGVGETGQGQPAQHGGAGRRRLDLRCARRRSGRRPPPRPARPARPRGRARRAPASTSPARQTLQYVGECGHPATQSSSPASRPGSARRRWGCARTAWRSGWCRTGFRRRVPRRCRQDGGGPPRRGSWRVSSRSACSNSTTGVNDSRTTLTSTPSRSAAPRGPPLDRGDDGVQGVLVGGAGVEPAADQGGDGVDAVGLDGDLAEGGDGARRVRPPGGRRARSRRSVSIGSRRSTRRVVPAWLASPAEVEPPAAVRPDGRGDADRVAGQVQRAALLDVEFDERADAGEPFGVGADGVRVVAGALHRLRQA